jgi:hypothetical protein
MVGLLLETENKLSTLLLSVQMEKPTASLR